LQKRPVILRSLLIVATLTQQITESRYTCNRVAAQCVCVCVCVCVCLGHGGKIAGVVALVCEYRALWREWRAILGECMALLKVTFFWAQDLGHGGKIAGVVDGGRTCSVGVESTVVGVCVCVCVCVCERECVCVCAYMCVCERELVLSRL